jgi:hypothetical protein
MADIDIGEIYEDIFINDNVDPVELQEKLKDYNDSLSKDEEQLKNIKYENDELSVGGKPYSVYIDGNFYRGDVSEIKNALSEYKAKLSENWANSDDLNMTDIINDVEDLSSSLCGSECSDNSISKIKDKIITDIKVDASKIAPDPLKFASPDAIDAFKNDPTSANAKKVVESTVEKTGYDPVDIDKKLQENQNVIKNYIDDGIKNSPDPKEKGFLQKLSDAIADNAGKLTLLIIAAVLTSEYITDSENQNSGCFITTTDTKGNISSCKYLKFTCKSQYKTLNSQCSDTGNYVCDSTKNPNCTVDDACIPDKDPGDISSKCSDNYMQTLVAGNSYDYQSIVCDASCALGVALRSVSRIVNKVVDAAGNAAGDLASIFQSIIKYFIYIAIGIALIMIVYYTGKYFLSKLEKSSGQTVSGTNPSQGQVSIKIISDHPIESSNGK